MKVINVDIDKDILISSLLCFKYQLKGTLKEMEGIEDLEENKENYEKWTKNLEDIEQILNFVWGL